MDIKVREQYDIPGILFYFVKCLIDESFSEAKEGNDKKTSLSLFL